MIFRTFLLAALTLTSSTAVLAGEHTQEERIIQSVPQRQSEYHDPRVVSPEASNKRLTQKSAFIIKEMQKKKLKDEAEMARIPSRPTLLPADDAGARLEMSGKYKQPNLNR